MLCVSCGSSTSTGSVSFDDVLVTRRSVRDYDGSKTISKEEAIMAVISLGYRNSDPATPGHRDFDEVVKFF